MLLLTGYNDLFWGQEVRPSYSKLLDSLPAVDLIAETNLRPLQRQETQQNPKVEISTWSSWSLSLTIDDGVFLHTR